MVPKACTPATSDMPHPAVAQSSIAKNEGWVFNATQLDTHGQWWSYRLQQWLHTLQWRARAGLGSLQCPQCFRMVFSLAASELSVSKSISEGDGMNPGFLHTACR
eukprot:gnl/Dysnectes_brevis/5820_a8616_505.p2 GENE.gnl/Dysnectes_brevis/5820_a8616_505~~gnl/Dysnectes_brevis/5820_a8616_505.p2  ORF type:complete len:105 (+),score=16.23 gnl/Dysnectes_brevis/5820_a8616_505:328-642(+)